LYFTQKTLLEVVFRHPTITGSWSHPEQSCNEVEVDEAQDAHLPADTDVARVE
jgi:hypothetical protein